MQIRDLNPKNLLIDKMLSKITTKIDNYYVDFNVSVREDSNKRNYILKVQGEYPNSMYCEMFLEIYDKEYPSLKNDINLVFDAAKHNISAAIEKIVEEDEYYLNQFFTNNV